MAGTGQGGRFSLSGRYSAIEKGINYMYIFELDNPSHSEIQSLIQALPIDIITKREYHDIQALLLSTSKNVGTQIRNFLQALRLLLGSTCSCFFGFIPEDTIYLFGPPPPVLSGPGSGARS